MASATLDLAGSRATGATKRFPVCAHNGKQAALTIHCALEDPEPGVIITTDDNAATFFVIGANVTVAVEVPYSTP